MITIAEENLQDQAGLERALTAYFQDIAQGPESFNALLEMAPVSCDFQNRSFVLKARLKPWMSNPNGILHGGITAAYLDYALGLLCRCFSTGHITPTLQMDVNYLRPGVIGDTIYVEAHLVKPGSRVCYAAGTVYPEGRPDKPIATATGTYYVTK